MPKTEGRAQPSPNSRKHRRVDTSCRPFAQARRMFPRSWATICPSLLSSTGHPLSWWAVGWLRLPEFGVEPSATVSHLLLEQGSSWAYKVTVIAAGPEAGLSRLGLCPIRGYQRRALQTFCNGRRRTGQHSSPRGGHDSGQNSTRHHTQAQGG